MSRWDLVGPNVGGPPRLIPIQRPIPSPTGQLGLEREVFQHGSVGDFIGSSLEGVQSGFVRCVYTAKHQPNNTVTLLCEKAGGCCIDWCCPKDQFWMTGVFILLAFVLFVFIVGACAMILCYQRSKIRQRKEEKEAFEFYQSQGGTYPISAHEPMPHFDLPEVQPTTYNTYYHRY